eukprot:scaffold14343_cov99-Isochrysis_galbana.AAC.2
MTWSSSSSPGKLARGGAGITKRPLGRTGGTDARTAPRATSARSGGGRNGGGRGRGWGPQPKASSRLF